MPSIFKMNETVFFLEITNANWHGQLENPRWCCAAVTADNIMAVATATDLPRACGRSVRMYVLICDELSHGHNTGERLLADGDY